MKYWAENRFKTKTAHIGAEHTQTAIFQNKFIGNHHFVKEKIKMTSENTVRSNTK
jgi:hypothetical protein